MAHMPAKSTGKRYGKGNLGIQESDQDFASVRGKSSQRWADRALGSGATIRRVRLGLSSQLKQAVGDRGFPANAIGIPRECI